MIMIDAFFLSSAVVGLLPGGLSTLGHDFSRYLLQKTQTTQPTPDRHTPRAGGRIHSIMGSESLDRAALFF